MVKNVLFKIIVLFFLLPSCDGQKKNSVLHNVTAKSGQSLNQSTYKALQAKKVNNQISQVVRTIFQDRSGTIWFGTEEGAFKFNGDSLIRIDGIKSESGKDVTIKGIAEGKDGEIWFGHTGGISSIDRETIANYYESDGLVSNDVWSITADRNGHIWIGTIEGVCTFNGQEFTKFDLPEGKVDSTRGLSSTKIVHQIFEDSKGTLWFSSNAGLFSYSSNKLVNVSNEVGIKTNFVNGLFEDRSGGLWISTKVDLYHVNENTANNITEGKVEVGKGIGSIAEGKDGNIWFVSNQHALYTYNGKELIEYQKSVDNKGPVVFQIFKDQDERLWFVGYGGAFRMENGKFLNVTKDGPW